jgi:two-component system, LuxR family, sensor kinase FixL
MRMTEDAQRAGAVVKRLRDFFRQGTTRLQHANMVELADEALAAQRRRAASVGVALRSQVAPGLPEVLLDRIQIAVVLRNLLANAIDAAATNTGHGRVDLRMSRVADSLQVDVLDNGPGVDAARIQLLFEPGPTDKPGGMGVGLSICRAIVEAHGGRLWAEAGDAGRFGFTLPIGEDSVVEHMSHAQ